MRLRAGGRAPSRELIRETLSKQIFGVDKSASAIRVASFSLYLLALDAGFPIPSHQRRCDSSRLWAEISLWGTPSILTDMVQAVG